MWRKDIFDLNKIKTANDLLNKAKKNGSIEYSEIDFAIKYNILRKDYLGYFLSRLEQENIIIHGLLTEGAGIDDKKEPSISPLNIYLHQIGRISLLSAGEELYIFSRISKCKNKIDELIRDSGNPKLIEAYKYALQFDNHIMIRANLRLVVSIA
ncbi:MAG: hypothetical protein KAR07_05645, partial [Spirochaetes bacterium]|nr:hypothetical protein [Spirochaetota bacterium]